MTVFKSIYFMVACLLLASCSKELDHPFDREYPIIESNPPIQLDTTGVTFSATLVSEGKLEIIDYGFIWHHENFRYHHSIKKTTSLDNFTLRVTTDMVKNEEYAYEPYVKAGDLVVVGPKQTYVSLGSSDPVIYDFFPKEVGHNDTVTIVGQHFSPFTTGIVLDFNNHGIIRPVISKVTVDTINFYIRRLAYPPNKTGDADIIVYTTLSTVRSSEKLRIRGPRIHGFNPKRGIIGETTITIEGEGFHPLPDSNRVEIGDIKAIVLDATPNQLTVMFPKDLVAGSQYINVQIGNEYVTSTQKLEVISRWNRSESFPGADRTAGNFIPIKDKGIYFGGRFKNTDTREVWEYDFQNDSWKQLRDFPGSARSSAVSFHLNDKIYYGTGAAGSYQILKDFWEYDYMSDEWKQIASFPGTPVYESIYYSIDGLGYLVGGRTSRYTQNFTNTIWVFNPSNQTWEQEYGGSIPISTQFPTTFFQHGDTGYFMVPSFEKILLYEFIPSSRPDFSSLLATGEIDINSSYLPAFTFVINDLLYIGAPLSAISNSRHDVHTYNFNTGEWGTSEVFPGGLINDHNSFSKENKGYVGFTTNSNGFQKGLWIYDPNIQ